jgi:hypothetical protein
MQEAFFYSRNYYRFAYPQFNNRADLSGFANLAGLDKDVDMSENFSAARTISPKIVKGTRSEVQETGDDVLYIIGRHFVLL